MGGKKNSTAVAGDLPAGTKQPRSKRKGPKIYSLSNTAQVDPGAALSDKSILEVVIQPDLEKKIVKLINGSRRENGERSPVSGRLTSRKLVELYAALQKFHFRTEHIEEAMRSSALYGGDLISALDWLCLNLEDGELPEGFGQKMQEEEEERRPRDRPRHLQTPPQHEPPADPPGLDKALHKPPLYETAKTPVKDEAASIKEWILRYAEQSSDDDSGDCPEEEEGDARRKAASHSPEPDGRSDPNDRYRRLTARLHDAMETAAVAKAKRDAAGQRTAQDMIRVIRQELKPLESHPMLDPALKVVDAPPPKERKALPVTVEKDELNLSLFEQATKPPPPPEKEVKENAPPKDVRNFDHAAACSWTGKSPKQFLIDWVRKNLPKSPPPAFHKVATGRHWRCRVRVQKADSILEVCPTILTEDSTQAQHLGATLALYHLAKGQSVHYLLPPSYRDVWFEWRDGEQQRGEESRTGANKARDQFIARLLTWLKQQKNRSHDHRNLEPQAQNAGGDDDEPEETWENLAGLDREEGGGGGKGDDTRLRKEAEERRRTETAGAVEAARTLLLELRKSPLAHKLLTERQQLPVFQHRQRVLEALQRHRVVVIAGETGSGKSTQIPQFVLDELLMGEGPGGGAPRPCNIVVTQPRRISAVSLACRVSRELGCDDGPGSARSLCGYHIRMEKRSGVSTRLLYCTTGVLLRRLQQRDRHLDSLTHVFVDEVHERSVQSDFLLTVLREVVMARRPDLRLVLMSATADCHKFSAYFDHCPVVAVPGRTFPVEVLHLEDVVEQTGYALEKGSEYSQRIVEEEEEVSVSVTQRAGKTSTLHRETIVKEGPGGGAGWDLPDADLEHFSSRTRHALRHMNPNRINMDLLLELLHHLDTAPRFASADRGAVLVFLPGLAHIRQLHDLLSVDRRFKGERDKERYRVVALHSALSSAEQALAFVAPPAGVRKIVLSTNIAETGVTIPDVTFVVDTGKTKENKYHASGRMSSLTETFVSKASALQRQGRAGRVRSGFCFRLYPRHRFESLVEHAVPEMFRVPLEELCLHVMKCEYGSSPEDFLGRAPDPPRPQSVSNAMGLLQRIGACRPDGHGHLLTPLGRHLAGLPVHVKIGKMLIYGAILGCLDPVATVAAAIAEKSPFSTPVDRKAEADLAKEALASANSDHLTVYNAYAGWWKARAEGHRAEMSYCRNNFLDRTALVAIEEAKRELMRMMQQAGFWSPSGAAPSSGAALQKEQMAVVRAALTAGLYDGGVARLLPNPSSAVDVLEKVACVAETPQGRAQVHPSSVNRHLQMHGWLLYQEKVRHGGRIYLRDTTLMPAAVPMLLFGGHIDVHHRERLVALDGWAYIRAPVRVGVLFKHLRTLVDSLLERKLEDPQMRLEDEKTIQLILELIKTERNAL